jgi:cyclopropane-fatty-acyl-phospholipid synthase
MADRDYHMDTAVNLSEKAVYSFDRWLVRKILAGMNEPPITFMLWNGETFSAGSAPSSATLQFKSRTALVLSIVNAEANFGDLYVNGQLEVVQGSLLDFVGAVYRSVSFTRWGERKSSFRLRKLLERPRENTVAGSKENIHHHYDIGNDFYRLWLDARMQYTCAYFRRPDMSLEDAQTAKLDHVCRKLRLKPGQTVVEAGCGWGGLALHMAKHYGVSVTAYNISSEQIRYARSKVNEEGLSVEFINDDYRNIEGKFDAFVSVGMLEHVGPQNYVALGELIGRVLRPNGLALIHTIGRNSALPMNSWIQKRIFPGAHPPSIREIMDIFEPASLSVLDIENLRLHYASTLSHWLKRYEQHETEVAELFDEAFVRTWRLYLAGSVASFEVGRLQLIQVLITHEKNNEIPMTRDDIYAVETRSGD